MNQWMKVQRSHDGFFQKTDFEDLPANVLQLLKEASLFYHVPYVYLVPGKESIGDDQICFFQVDHNWVLALMDGICSVGRNASIDYSHDTEVIVREYKKALGENHTVRQKLQGKEEKETGTGGNIDGKEDLGIVSGFLLHSVLVDDFRGLEFSAYGQIKGGEPLTALRIETLGKQFLMGLFRGEIQRLEITQPPEGLHFGFISEDRVLKKTMRNLSDGKLNQNTVVIPQKPTAAGRIIDIKKTAENMKKSLGQTEITSAQIALQMIQNAQTGVFTIG